ncbi:MAG TPA: long-chain fatty acid--CoA ligase [Erysipelotrichaceae bacterium]|nr:long-chain fatty acid--CoA ligase [Erysipelotrichaceae bacterium]
MKKLTNDSCYVRLKKHLTSKTKILVVDKDGQYFQDEAFDIYCGMLNEISTLKVRRGQTFLIAPFVRKETILIAAAIVSLGGTIMFGNPKRTREGFVKQLDPWMRFDATVIFNGQWYVEKGKKTINLSLTRQALKAKPLKRASKTKPSFYIVTSGSTGKNKIIALSEYGFLNHIEREVSDIASDNGMTYCCLPINHIFGIASFFQHIITGNSFYLSDTCNPDFALDIIEKYRCSALPNVPTFFYMLMEAQSKKSRDISSLKVGVIAGGPYSKEQFEKIEKTLGITLCSSYGMTEASTVICSSPNHLPLEERSVGVGKPFPGVDVVLKDSKGTIVEKTGEICFKGYNLMLGYLTEKGLDLPLDKEGYFHTGDIGQYDDEGIMRIIGRTKDIIIRGGENLSPSIIEQKIATISGVKDVCVVGILSRKYGEVVAAYIASDNLTKEQLIEELKNVLIKIEMPEKIIIRHSIPLLMSGKHDKILVKKMLMDKE